MTLAAEKMFAVEGIRIPDSHVARKADVLADRAPFQARQFLQCDSRIGLERLTVRAFGTDLTAEVKP